MAKAKNSKNRQRPAGGRADESPTATAPTWAGTISPPTKKPTLLATSIVLFGLWFVYLLVVALGG